MENTKPKTLRNLKPGEHAKIKSIGGQGVIRRRIVDMGLVPGMDITLERYAPLGDPMEVKIKNLLISLRKEEAETIVLE